MQEEWAVALRPAAGSPTVRFRSEDISVWNATAAIVLEVVGSTPSSPPGRAPCSG